MLVFTFFTFLVFLTSFNPVARTQRGGEAKTLDHEGQFSERYRCFRQGTWQHWVMATATSWCPFWIKIGKNLAGKTVQNKFNFPWIYKVEMLSFKSSSVWCWSPSFLNSASQSLAVVHSKTCTLWWSFWNLQSYIFSSLFLEYAS